MSVIGNKIIFKINNIKENNIPKIKIENKNNTQKIKIIYISKQIK